VTINSRRKIFSLLRGPFSQAGIVEFIRELVAQRGMTIPFRKDTLPTIQTVEPWDGKDGEVQI
jgi:protein disulfide-isomerase A6